MGAFKYLIALIIIGVLMYGVSQLLHYHDEEGSELSQTEVPANMLIYAKEDVKKSYYTTALEHVDNAITNMRQAELTLDDQSDIYIEQSIEDLHQIERELRSGFLFEEDLNASFAKALNTLAYAYLRVSEAALAEDQQAEALQALRIAVNQLDYSMRFATGELFDHEQLLMTSLAKMLEEQNLNLAKLHPLTEGLEQIMVGSLETTQAP
ncbi:MAG: hypothetical protein RIF33_11585 [Cyclobacteriaceae bacterium]